MASLTSEKLITIKELQEDSPVSRKKIVGREAVSYLHFAVVALVFGAVARLTLCVLGTKLV